MAHARGKVILLGEHAVVYGVPAIAAGIDRGARALARRAAEASIRVKDHPPSEDLARALGELLGELGSPPVEVEVELELPAGAGLGASAAMAVAVARAVWELEPRGSAEEQPARVLAAATAWERVFHGNPSGIDAAAAAGTGCIWFQRGEPPEPISLGAPLVLAIAIAGPPASTKLMVESVARLLERRPGPVKKTLEGIQSLVRNARLAIEAGDRIGLGRLLDLNQMLLSGLFLSTEEIERACHLARAAGALGAKLTGAGGGGAVLALADEDPEPVLAAWRAEGLECFAARIDEGPR
jgi:mevalonate kinase